MTQLIESTISERQIGSFVIDDFIFHIIDVENQAEGDGVVYLDDVALNERQRAFFLDRIKDATTGTQYLFSPPLVSLKRKVTQLESPDDDFSFNAFSRAVTEDFARKHSGNMSSGIFVVCKVHYQVRGGDELGKFIFLVKMDKQSSFKYSFTERDGRRVATIEENHNSLGERKDSIQKSALIDLSNLYSWNVLAYDRTKKAGLSDYFKEFLGVTERQTNGVLTKTTYSVVKMWAKSLPEEAFPNGEDANTLVGRALNYLCDNTVFDTDLFINTVIRDSDITRKEVACQLLRTELVTAGIAGQTFEPQPGSIAPKEKKLVYITEEGVIISYEGSSEAANIRVVKESDGSSVITIRTGSLTIK